MHNYAFKELQLIARPNPSLPVSVGSIIGKSASNPQECFDLIKSMKWLTTEVMVILHLDTHADVIAFQVGSVGTISSVACHPREVFRAAILNGSYGIIVAHNHPSGNPTPSDADNAVTDNLAKGGHLIQIELYDSMIIGEDSYYSYRETQPKIWP